MPGINEVKNTNVCQQIQTCTGKWTWALHFWWIINLSISDKAKEEKTISSLISLFMKSTITETHRMIDSFHSKWRHRKFQNVCCGQKKRFLFFRKEFVFFTFHLFSLGMRTICFHYLLAKYILDERLFHVDTWSLSKVSILMIYFVFLFLQLGGLFPRVFVDTGGWTHGPSLPRKSLMFIIRPRSSFDSFLYILALLYVLWSKLVLKTMASSYTPIIWTLL